MNNRIRELAEQAGWGKGQSYDDCVQCSPFCTEEFAKSIIQECIKSVVSNGTNRPDYYVRIEAAKDIENNFGIERPDDETEQLWWQAIK